jgi:hypothetical protein
MVNIFERLVRSSAVFLLSAAAILALGNAHATCTPPPAWSPNNTYNVGDVVAYDVVSANGTLISGAFYQSLVSSNIGSVPASSPAQWNGSNILVCKFTVQPVDVCSSAGTKCPVINSLGQTAVSNPGTTLIGTIDPAHPTAPSLDQLAFAQIGVSMVVNPVVLWKSPANPFSTARITEPDYGWLHVCACNSSGSSTSCPSINSCTLGASSADLLNVTQQPQIATVTGYTPTFPLSSLHNLNLAFVHVIRPLSTGTITNGFSWPGNNGGAIASDNVFPAISPGTVAHELGHQLGPPSVDGHTILGAGPLTCPAPYPDPNSECTENLLTAGNSVRQKPNGLNNCGATQNQACWVPQVPPNDTTPPDALNLLTTGGVGQCTTVNNMLQCPSQQAAYLLSTAMDTIPNTVSTVSGGSTTASTQSATKNNTGTAQSNTSSSGNPIVFDVSGQSGFSSGVTLLAYVVIIPQPSAGSPQFTFSSNPFNIISQSRRNLLQDFDLQPLDNDVPYPPCSATGVLCGEVEFNRNPGKGFGVNDFMQFSLAILKGGAPAASSDLCGAKVAFIYSDGYTPVSNLGSSSCSGSSNLIATSLGQDPMTAAQVVTLPTSPLPNNMPACTLLNGHCTNPMMSGSTDSNPAFGLESPTCFDANGFPIPCQQ